VLALYGRGARSIGISRLDIIRHVIFPNIAPNFFVGLRLAMTMTLLGVVLAELYVSTPRIGYFTRMFAGNYNPAPLFALIARWRQSRSRPTDPFGLASVGWAGCRAARKRVDGPGP